MGDTGGILQVQDEMSLAGTAVEMFARINEMLSGKSVIFTCSSCGHMDRWLRAEDDYDCCNRGIHLSSLYPTGRLIVWQERKA